MNQQQTNGTIDYQRHSQLMNDVQIELIKGFGIEKIEASGGWTSPQYAHIYGSAYLAVVAGQERAKLNGRAGLTRKEFSVIARNAARDAVHDAA